MIVGSITQTDLARGSITGNGNVDMGQGREIPTSP